MSERIEEIRARLARWPEAVLTPQVIRDEADFKYPCLRHDEESHVSFDFQQGDLEKQSQRETSQGTVIEAAVVVRPVNAFCANVSSEMADSIAKAPQDIRFLLERLAAAEARVAEAIAATWEEAARVAEAYKPRWATPIRANAEMLAAGIIAAALRGRGRK